MKKRIVFICLSILLLCGCEAVYNIDLDDGFNENIMLNLENPDEINRATTYYDNLKYTAHLADDYDPEEAPPEDVEYYNVKMNDANKLIFSYKFKDNFEDARAPRHCFPSFRYIKGKYIRFNTLTDNTCFDMYPSLSKITINIKSSNKVNNHNADSVNNNVYTWVIKRGEYRAINIEVENPDYESDTNNLDNITPKEGENKKNNESKTNDKKQEKNETNDKRSITLIALLTGLFFIVLFGIIIFRNKFNGM